MSWILAQPSSAKADGKKVGVQPSERFYHSATLMGSMMYVIGGTNGSKLFDDVWSLQLKNGPDYMHWTKVVVTVRP